MTTPTPADLDALLCTLSNAADNKGLDIGTAWNLLDDAADAITALRAQVAEARKRADRVVAVWEDQEVRGWWDRMDAAIAALGGE